jgi:hypothetical protein
VTPVRIAAWNCCGGGTNKLPVLLERLEPDIAVLPEFATHPLRPDLFSGTSLLSAGTAGRKGVVVASFGGWKAAVSDLPGPFPLTLLPVEVDGPRSFRLLAVWANLAPPPKQHPVVEFAERHPDWFEEPVVVAGDFNTSGITKSRNGGSCATGRRSGGLGARPASGRGP